MSAASDLPEPAANLELERLLGAWYVLFTNYELWRTRTHPRIEYTPIEPDERGRFRMHDALRYRQADLFGRVSRKLLVGVDVAERPGQFVWRGQGVLRLIKSRWCVALIDPEYRWCVTYFARSNIGTGAGMDIYTRDPSIPQGMLDEILAQVRAHPFLGQAERVGRGRRCNGLFATEQDWRPAEGYRLT